VSGLTAIVGAFFIKDYLGLSAAFLAGLAFWAGIPWAFKLPLGHIVDLVWRWKSLLVYLGAMLIATSSAIMWALIAHTGAMADVMTVEAWFILAALLAPGGYVIQDVVADAMTVEAVPRVDAKGTRWRSPGLMDTFLLLEESVRMPRTRNPYPAAFRTQIIALARRGRSDESLARPNEFCVTTSYERIVQEFTTIYKAA
jgi:hypothetical protein